MVEYEPYVIVGALLFALGMVGFACRRNLIIMFLCTEMMLRGVVLNLVGLGVRFGFDGREYITGQTFALFLLVVAAAEAALALGLVVYLWRGKGTLDAEVWASLRG